MTLSPATLLSFVAWEPLAKAARSYTPETRVKMGPPPPHVRVENPYQGTIDFQGLEIWVENAKGSTRRGVAPDGTAWATKMTAHYGEFADTLGVDGDPVDVFVGPDATAPTAYVVHRKHPGTEVFDEDKVIVGCGTAKEAEALFRANYDKPGNLGGVTAWPVAELREYLQGGQGRGERLDSPSRVRIMLRKAVPGPGWSPIPKGRKGGYRKRAADGKGWEYWYADQHSHREQGTQPHHGQRTIGASEEDVRRLVDHLLEPHDDHGIIKIDDEPGSIVSTAGYQTKLPTGAPTTVNIRLVVARPDSPGAMVSGEPGNRKKISLYVPPTPYRREKLAAELRSILAHELSHVLDVTPDHAQGIRAEVSGIRAGGDTSKAYFNDPTEVKAYRHQIFRELNTPEVHEKVQQMAASNTGKTRPQDTPAVRKEVRQLFGGAGGEPIHPDIAGIDKDADLTADNIVARLHAHSPTWRKVHQHFAPEARRKVLTMAADVLSRHVEGTSRPMEKGAPRNLDVVTELLAMFKATIRTPVGSDGKVDYDRVPIGASIWVSVKEGPLAGRPILITKRPDHQFALTGGSAAKYILARKHLVTSHGKPRATQADEAELTRRQEAEEKNAPAREQVRAIRKQARGLQAEATANWMDALGVRSEGLSKEEKGKVVDAVRSHALASGLDERGAEAMARFVSEGIARKDDEHRQKKAAQRLEVARKVAAGQPPEEAAALAAPEAVAPAFTMPVVEPEAWNAMNESEREHLVLADLDSQERKAELDAIEASRFDVDDVVEKPAEVEKPPQEAAPTIAASTENPAPAVESSVGDGVNDGHAEFENGHRPEEEPEAEAPPLDQPTGPSFTVGAHDGAVQIGGVDEAEQTPAVAESQSLKAPEPPAFVSREKAEDALRHFRSFAEAKKLERAAAGAMEKLPPMENAMPTALEDLRLRAGVATDEEVAQVLDDYVRQALAPPDDGFYDALSPHWNETTGNKLAGAVTKGAASAITGLVGEATGARFDVERLVDTLGPEAAAMATVARMREEMSPEEFHRWTGELRDHNATNQGAAEKKAMTRHAELLRQHEDLQRQIKRGDLRSEGTIATLTARNLLEQRENLGSALGSLQASAALYHFADAAKDAKFRKQPVVITVGSKAALNDKLKRLGKVSGSEVHYDVGRGVYQIHTDTAGLRKFVGRTEADKNDSAKWEKVKFDASGVEHDEQGREWVPDYKVPGFRSHFGEADTLPVEQRHLAGQKIQLLADQRNNIEWLHGSGGGVVTSRTGGGKTLVSVGVASKMLHENPRGMHLRVVPDGREEQWAAEIKNFSGHAPVVLPASSSKAERARILAGAAPGSIVIVGHTHAGRHDYDALATAHAWDSIGIDEPQELRSKSGNGKMSAGARRIFKIPAKNRHALTATPASDHPVEVYDVVNWARPGALGYRSRFKRAFSGFGGGTNAQDAALQRMLYRELAPHVSGERLVPPHYNVDHHDERVEVSAGQLAKQREIEGRVDSTIATAVEDAKQKKAAGIIGYADKHPSQLSREAKEKALGKLEAEHRANLSGGDVEHNPKLAALRDQVAKAAPGERHVVFVDSHDQRRAVTSMLEAAGHKGKIRNITASAKGEVVKGEGGQEVSAIEARKRAWKQTPGGILLIDRTSASGHNLAEGDHLHVLGNPDDAAQMLQAHGRLGRANRVGDFKISTYKYQDSPFEHLQWNRLHRQLKVLRATAPAMFVEGRTAQAGPLAKAVRFILRRLGKGFQLGLFGGGA